MTSLVSIFLWVICWIIPLTVLSYVAYFLVTVPLRRKERARFFLDLLESEMKRGGNPEQAVVALSRSRDRSLGARFYLLASHLENGLRLGQALDKVPRFLPPKVNAILQAGEAIGDVRKTLPVAKSLLTDADSRHRSAHNYLIVLAFVFMPLIPVFYLFLHAKILPVFAEIFHGLTQNEANLPHLLQFSIDKGPLFAKAQLALSGLVYAAAFCYVGGPRVSGWFRLMFGPLVDELALRVPWKRKRVLQTFSAVLSLLLDAEVPEPVALKLAGKSTANEAFQLRAARAGLLLEQGGTLSAALNQLDDSGEFHWRLTNAAHSPGGFRAALDGWLESLDARAFRDEQAFSQAVTTLLLLINATMIGFFVAGIFQMPSELANLLILW